MCFDEWGYCPLLWRISRAFNRVVGGLASFIPDWDTFICRSGCFRHVLRCFWNFCSSCKPVIAGMCLLQYGQFMMIDLMIWTFCCGWIFCTAFCTYRFFVFYVHAFLVEMDWIKSLNGVSGYRITSCHPLPLPAHTALKRWIAGWLVIHVFTY